VLARNSGKKGAKKWGQKKKKKKPDLKSKAIQKQTRKLREGRKNSKGGVGVGGGGGLRKLGQGGGLRRK